MIPEVLKPIHLRACTKMSGDQFFETELQSEINNWNKFSLPGRYDKDERLSGKENLFE